MKFKYVSVISVCVFLGIFLIFQVVTMDSSDEVVVPPEEGAVSESPADPVQQADSDSDVTIAGRELADLEENGIPGLSISGLLAYIPMEELIEDSVVIATGVVGETVATDYPAKYQNDLPPDDDLEAQERYITRVYTHRLAFHEFSVSEVLKGDPVDSFIFARSDVAYYEKTNITELLPGSRILLFVRDPVNLNC